MASKKTVSKAKQPQKGSPQKASRPVAKVRVVGKKSVAKAKGVGAKKVLLVPRKTKAVPPKKAVSPKDKKATKAAVAKHVAVKKRSTHKKGMSTAWKPIAAILKQSSAPTQKFAAEKAFIRQLPVSTLPPPLPPPPPVRIKAMTQSQQKLTAKELKEIRVIMLRERMRLTGTTQGLREQSLLRNDEVNHEEEGTDAFIRLQDLDRACSSHATIAQIDVALRMLDDGIYGLCERCEGRIESPRLRALPFVKTCIKCQAETEGGHRGKISVRHLLWDR